MTAGTPYILDLSTALEANVYDLSIKMERTMKDDQAKRVFSIRVDAERHHLDEMASLIESKVW